MGTVYCLETIMQLVKPEAVKINLMVSQLSQDEEVVKFCSCRTPERLLSPTLAALQEADGRIPTSCRDSSRLRQRVTIIYRVIFT